MPYKNISNEDTFNRKKRAADNIFLQLFVHNLSKQEILLNKNLFLNQSDLLRKQCMQ